MKVSHSTQGLPNRFTTEICPLDPSARCRCRRKACRQTAGQGSGKPRVSVTQSYYRPLKSIKRPLQSLHSRLQSFIQNLVNKVAPLLYQLILLVEIIDYQNSQHWNISFVEHMTNEDIPISKKTTEARIQRMKTNVGFHSPVHAAEESVGHRHHGAGHNGQGDIHVQNDGQRRSWDD